MTPQPGAYRPYLPPHLRHVRLAKADQPIQGCSRLSLDDPRTTDILGYFDIEGDEVAAWYANAIRTRAVIPVIPYDTDSGRVWAPGELFLRS